MNTEDIKRESLSMHEKLKGKLEVTSMLNVDNGLDLARAYTPGISSACLKIAEDKQNAYKYTIKGKTIAIISNGTSVLGLGDIGPEASLPVIEGKALLHKRFGGVNAFPLIINSKDPDVIVETICNISCGFGGIHLEDIKAPECFYIEDELKRRLDIPVYHDDQHGSSISILAGLINALKLENKKLEEVKIVISGAGASGIATTRLLLSAGAKNIIVVDSKGAIVKGDESLNEVKKEIADLTNLEKETGSLKEVIQGKDVFIGLSDGNILDKEDIKKMNNGSIVFALANPIPEIMPEEAKKAGARVIATGRSDFPNQLNNVLVFPGLFRGLIDGKVTEITEEIKLKAAYALASLVKDEELNENYIIPTVFDERVSKAVSKAVGTKKETI